jgi:hypothetical protein
MNQPDPASEPPPLASPGPPFKDRRGGLLVFGIFLIIAGTFVLMGALSSLLAPLLPTRPGVAVPSRTMLLSSVCSSLPMGSALTWLGIGSIRARRWARAILLCLGWIGLIAGLLSLGLLGSMLDALDVAVRQQAQPIPASLLAGIKVFTVALMVGLYVIAPAALILFYRSPHVRLTCEHRDPVPRWTDRCPLPVLAFTLVQGYSGVSLLAMLPAFGGVFPLAGWLITGIPAHLLWLGCIALCFYSAVGFYRLSRRAWWIWLAATSVLGLSAIVTFTQIDLLDYYRAVGFSAEDLRLLAQHPFTRSGALGWLSAGGTLLLLAYWFWIGKFFRPAAPG